MRHSIFKTHGNNILQMRTFMSGRKLKITASWRSAAPPQIADLHDTGSGTTLLGVRRDKAALFQWVKVPPG
jgi:hypothetical protein